MFRFSRFLPLLPVLLILSACQSGGTEPVPTLPDTSFQLDTTFNSTGAVPGVLTTTLSNGSDTALGMAIQADGKIVTAGSILNGVTSDIAVVRYNGDGTLDTSGFNAAGAVPGVITTDINSTNQSAYAIALQGSNIVVAGVSYNTTTALNNFVVARYTSAGVLDTTFNAAGNAYDAAGAATAAVNPAGIVTVAAAAGNSQAHALVIQGDNRIVVAGLANNTANDDIAVLRFMSDGTLDGSFGSNGITLVEVNTVYSAGTAANDSAKAVRLQSDGKIVVAGTSNGAAVMLRLNTDGSRDTTYGNGATTSGITLLTNLTEGNALVIQPDDRAVIGGVSPGDGNDMAVARLTTGGVLDINFNTTGAVPGIATVGFLAGRNETVTSLALQSDGKIVAAGGAASYVGYDFALIRLNTNGTLDTDTDADPLVTFGLGGKVSTPIGYSADAINSIAIQGAPGNEIVAAGGSWLNNRWIMALARYLP
jgi:uncharacterized delta-60 repeat protein